MFDSWEALWDEWWKFAYAWGEIIGFELSSQTALFDMQYFNAITKILFAEGERDRGVRPYSILRWRTIDKNPAGIIEMSFFNKLFYYYYTFHFISTNFLEFSVTWIWEHETFNFARIEIHRSIIERISKPEWVLIQLFAAKIKSIEKNDNSKSSIDLRFIQMKLNLPIKPRFYNSITSSTRQKM